MPFDVEPWVARDLHQRRCAEWSASFAAQLRQMGSKRDIEQLVAIAGEALAQTPGIAFENPGLAARMWVEANGLPR